MATLNILKESDTDFYRDFGKQRPRRLANKRNHRRLKCRNLITLVPNAGTLSAMLVNFVLQAVFWAKYSTYNQNALQLLHVQTVITLKYIRLHPACSEIFSIYLLIKGCWHDQSNDGSRRLANKIRACCSNIRKKTLKVWERQKCVYC
jgi:hypothetical protein